jgi:hypothetical protein
MGKVFPLWQIWKLLEKEEVRKRRTRATERITLEEKFTEKDNKRRELVDVLRDSNHVMKCDKHEDNTCYHSMYAYDRERVGFQLSGSQNLHFR